VQLFKGKIKDFFFDEILIKISLCCRNPKVQLKGLNLGFVQYLLRLLNTETDNNMKIRLLFTLSTLLRNNPQAQIKFLEYGGIETIIKLIDQTNSNKKIKMRAIELMNDLIIEKVRKKKICTILFNSDFYRIKQLMINDIPMKSKLIK
jgi:hypothetical protein